MVLLEDAESEIINVRYIDEVFMAEEIIGVDRPCGVRSVYRLVQVF